MEAESSTGQQSNDAGLQGDVCTEVPEIPGLEPGGYDMGQTWRDLYHAHLDGNAWPLGAGPRNPSFRADMALTCDTFEVRLTLEDRMGGFRRLCYLEPDDARILARELERAAALADTGKAIDRHCGGDSAAKGGLPC